MALRITAPQHATLVALDIEQFDKSRKIGKDNPPDPEDFRLAMDIATRWPQVFDAIVREERVIAPTVSVWASDASKAPDDLKRTRIFKSLPALLRMKGLRR